jgi:hypothetical protein
MNQAQSHPISFDSRSSDLARVCLALAKTNSKAAWLRRHHRKATGADLNRHPLGILSLPKCDAPPSCARIQSP